MTLEEEIRRVRALRERKDDLAQQADAARVEWARAREALWERMDATGVKSIGIDDRRYSAKTTIYGSVNDKTALRRWAVDEGNAPELFEPEPRKKLINELVRQRLDNNEELPPGVTWYPENYVSDGAA
ncbi:MAG: gp33 family protein [Solirubrobacteraceae bacterium]